MPTYEYLCTNIECNHEWEEYHSIKAEPVKICEKYHQETAKRLISGGSGKGVVSLVGQDLVNKIKSDASSIEKHASQNEGFASNFIGPDVYQRKQMALDNAKKGIFRRPK